MKKSLSFLLITLGVIAVLNNSCKKEDRDYSNNKRQVAWFVGTELNPSLDKNFLMEGNFPTSNGYEMTVDDFHCNYGSIISVGSFHYQYKGAYKKTFQEVTWLSPEGEENVITLEMIDFATPEDLVKFLGCRINPSLTGDHSFDGIYYDTSHRCLTGINFPNFYRYSTQSYLGGRNGTIVYYQGDTLQLPGEVQIPCIYMHTENPAILKSLDFQTGYSHPAELVYAYNANPHSLKRVAGY
jgi:hypothetical protein